MAELGSSGEVRAPHVFEIRGDVLAAEQTLTLYEAAVFRRLVFSYEGGVGVSAMDLYGLVVAKEFDAC